MSKYTLWVILGPFAASTDWAQKKAARETTMKARDIRPNMVDLQSKPPTIGKTVVLNLKAAPAPNHLSRDGVSLSQLFRGPRLAAVTHLYTAFFDLVRHGGLEIEIGERFASSPA
ncbi:hypothetical protein LshimejAT787_0406250 [Lyophyllum shimeji]|uniref:Uncharacterized protein n=1 Tax=Lyophyllum shimeji TaxID=47721 RepID=A0A9P3PLE9_LYOSH|nr:hypothetical protein LshimejAT787_0406250 [Lyophyllum shimeji]